MDDISNHDEPSTLTPRSLSARVGFWAVGAVVAAGAGFGLGASQGDNDVPGDRETVLDETTTTTTGEPVVSTSVVDNAAEPAFDFGATVSATGRLESYEVVLIQEMSSMVMRAESVQVGTTASSSTDIAGHTASSRLVDGRIYELDGEVWYLKPSPARALVTNTLADITNSLRDLPAVEVERTADAVVLEITCRSAQRSEVPEIARVFCDDRATTTAVIDLSSGLLSNVRTEGEIEIYPGSYEKGFVEIQISPLDASGLIEAPADVDLGRSTCISERLGTFDYAEMSSLLDETTTEENGDIFTSCGFDLYPAGNDFGTGG